MAIDTYRKPKTVRLMRQEPNLPIVQLIDWAFDNPEKVVGIGLAIVALGFIASLFRG